MRTKPYREFVEDAPCDCIGGFTDVQYGQWYETYSVECQKCNGGENSDKEFSKIHNMSE